MRIGFWIAKSHLILTAIVFATACGSDSVIVPASNSPGDDSWQLKPLSATQLSGIVGEAAEPAPTVVVSRGGHPVAGITVSFTPVGDLSVTSSVANTTAITNAQGIATAGNWRLGTTAGSHELRASIPDAPTVFFFGNAMPAAPAGISPGAGEQFGLPGFAVSAPSVYLKDRFGNAVGAGFEVKFRVTAGGGQLARTEVRTDATGFASPGSWHLGPSPGLNSVEASALSLDPVTFTAEAEDTGQLTWYDLEAVDSQPLDQDPDSFYRASCCWIALSESRHFLLVSDYGWLGANQSSGTYELSGTDIVLKHSDGEREEGTLLDASLSIHRDDGYMTGLWSYVRRTGTVSR